MELAKESIFKNSVLSKLIAIFCTALWGTTAPVIKLIFDDFKVQNSDTPKQIYIAGVCFVLSGIFTLVLPCIKRKKIIIISRKTAIDTLLVAVIQTTLQYTFFYIGLSNTTSAKASIISSFCTFFIIILSHFIYKDEKLNTQKVFGCMFGILGMIILNLEYGQTISLDFSPVGEGFIFLAALSIAVPTPICKKLSLKEDVTVFTGNSFLVGGALLVLIGWLLNGKNLNMLSGGNFTLIIYLSLSSSMAGVLWNCLLKNNDVSKISMYNLLVPIFGTMFSCILVKENIYDVRLIISLILVSLGIYMVERPQHSHFSLK